MLLALVDTVLVLGSRGALDAFTVNGVVLKE